MFVGGTGCSSIELILPSVSLLNIMSYASCQVGMGAGDLGVVGAAVCTRGCVAAGVVLMLLAVGCCRDCCWCCVGRQVLVLLASS